MNDVYFLFEPSQHSNIRLELMSYVVRDLLEFVFHILSVNIDCSDIKARPKHINSLLI